MILQKIYHNLIGYKSRTNYWSCSDTAKQLQIVHGITPKPPYATSQEWKEWRVAAEKASPVGYWITEELLNNLQDIWLFIPDLWNEQYGNFRNAFIRQHHLLKTGLNPRRWHESDTRIRAALFQLMIDFVEIEKAHMYDMATECGDDEEDPTPHITNRREAGIAHLDWEISLGDESPYQSESAIEIKDIYSWIKDVYPNRHEPYDVHGWSEYCDSKENMFDMDDETPEEREHVRQMLNKTHELEEAQRDEVTDILIRIVKVRRQMWT